MYSFVIYLLLGAMLLGRVDLLLVIFGVMLLHEAGHLVAMKLFRYTDVTIFFLPFVGAFAKGSKRELSQKQSAIIYLAGPLPGAILGIVLHLSHSEMTLGDIPVQLVAQLLIWGNLMNLLPIYPLDGGQLLNRVFLGEEGKWSTAFIILSAVLVSWIAIKSHYYFLLLLPAFVLYRYFNTSDYSKPEKEIEDLGIDLNKDYPDLSNENYWKIRTVLIRHFPTLRNENPGPPYAFSSKEDQIAGEVKNILQRTLLMDMSMMAKLILLFTWMLSLTLPWWFQIDFLVLKYLGQ
ncbi:MAG TPA: hypothetical protein PK191_07625 [Niabella sp.]|nr:hypothetical protein [Niabella sp.]HOZ97625.1 hypothetical protein [Niabella sp.]HQW15763.1 hypothetical protein [Niabella sp.]HQX21038.1 hypothetical protein [Niabella sp.]HQX41865.1 hypothetical protein [Niabella sp.]